MKKILFSLGLCLCLGSVGMSQNNHAVSMNMEQAISPLSQYADNSGRQVGYKGSIFTKAEGDVLFSCDFSFEEMNDGIFRTGKVFRFDRLDGQDVTDETAHTQQGKYGEWARFDNATVDYLRGRELENTYTYLANWFGGLMAAKTAEMMDSNRCSSNNGWMFMEVFDQTTIGGAAFNAYIKFKQFNLHDAPTADIQFYQSYMKFYDQCFVDYSFDGEEWYSHEINVTNIDLVINGAIQGVSTYTLPYHAIRRANTENNGKLNLRLRWYSNVRSTYAGYGYYWMVDDFKVIAGGESRVLVGPQYYTEGVYQMVPKGMQLPLFWHASVTNTGSLGQENLTASIYNYKEGDAAELISRSRNGYISRGQSTNAYIDNFGLYADETNYGWWCMSSNVRHAENGFTNHVKTNEAGNYYVYAQVSSAPENGDQITHTFDTIYYRVNDADENGNYVWGHDNGVITAGRAYIYGFVVDHGNSHSTEASANYKSAGYSVSVRYTMGDRVPVDAKGRPWVIRGVEYVPATDTGIRNGNATIIPTLTMDSCIPGSPNSVIFNNVRTGTSSVTITKDSYTDANGNNLEQLFSQNYLLTQSKGNGFLTRDDYKDGAIFVEFPEQPVLEAGKSYRVGYQMAEAGKFAVAASSPDYYYTYLREGKTDSIRYYAFNDTVRPGIGKYASRTAKTSLDNPYDVRVYDNVVDRSVWASQYYGYYPMIHLIVGPRVDKAKHGISFECNYEVGEEDGLVYNDANQEVCNLIDSVTDGAASGYSFRAGKGCRIDSIAIDGVPVWSAKHGRILDESDYAEDMVHHGDTIVALDFLDVRENHNVEVWYAEGRIPDTPHTPDTPNASKYGITIVCSDNEGSGEVYSSQGTALCGTTDSVSANGSVSYTIRAEEGSYITNILFDNDAMYGYAGLDDIIYEDGEFLIACTLNIEYVDRDFTITVKYGKLPGADPQPSTPKYSIQLEETASNNAAGKVLAVYNIIAEDGSFIDSVAIDNHPVYGYISGQHPIENTIPVTITYYDSTMMEVAFQNIRANHVISVWYNRADHSLDVKTPKTKAYCQIQPNPASDKVQLTVTGITDIVNYSIINAAGQTVLSGQFKSENSHTADVSRLSTGTYFVKFYTDTFSITEKLIIR